MLPGERELLEWRAVFRFLPLPKEMPHVTLIIIRDYINEWGSNLHVVGLTAVESL